MREALDMLFEEGLENVWERHRVLAEECVLRWKHGICPMGFHSYCIT